MIISQIEFNPKDVEQHSEINSNCDRDYYQVIFFTEFFKFKLLFDSSWIFAQVIGIIWSNLNQTTIWTWKIQWKKSLGNNLDRNLNWSHCAALHLLDWTQFERWSFSVDEMNKLLKNLVKHFQDWESMLRNWMSSMLHKIPLLQYVTVCYSM
jgi:hypothetical protein